MHVLTVMQLSLCQLSVYLFNLKVMYNSTFKPNSVNKPTFGMNGKSVIKLIDCPTGSYCKNTDGFIRNDFSVLMDSQDRLSMQRALDAMREYTEQSEDNSNKSFEEIVALVRPRWCQSPAELDRFELYCIDNALDVYSKLKKLDDEQKEALAKAKGEELKRLRDELKQELSGSSSASVESKSE